MGQKKTATIYIDSQSRLLASIYKRNYRVFKNKRETFTFPIDAYGTAFQLSVWNTVREIPYGKTYSYTEIADRIQKPTAVRAVASAIAANPILITIPCHRVIGKNGKLTGFRGGLEMKKELLVLEKLQVEFI